MWPETFNHEVNDILGVQDKVARAVAGALTRFYCEGWIESAKRRVGVFDGIWS